MRQEHKYALIWKNGKYSVGDESSIARAYCKTKRLILGLLKLNGHNRLVYSLKINGQWKPQGTISNMGNNEANRRAAFRDFFRNHLLNNQDEYSIISLTDNSR